MTDSRYRCVAFGILVALGALLYGYTLSYPFLFDDQVYLLENPLVTEGKNFAFFFDFHSFAIYSKRLGLDADLSVNFILRPITYLTFFFNYAIDGWNPRGFRAVNVVIHCANALVLFQLLFVIVQRSPKHIPTRLRSARFIALAGALLFLVHPLATESVTYIIQRFTSLSTFFYLLVLWTYLESLTSPSARATRTWKWISVASLITGMLSKEILFTAPFLLVILDFLVMGTSPKTAARRALSHLCCLPIIPILMTMTSSALRSKGLHMSSTLFVADMNHSQEYQYHYALTQAPVVLTYLRMLLLPYGQNLDPDFPVLKSFWDLRVWGSFTTIFAIIGGLGWWYARRRDDLHRSLIFCGVIWFFLCLSISSSIVPLPDVMAEHRSYLPSIGIFVALACALNALWIRCGRDENLAPLAPALASAWILVLVGATVFRHQAWSSEIAMWTDVATNSPRKSRAWLNLGAAYVRSGRLEEACGIFRRCILLAPRRVEGYINLASTQADLHLFREALATASTAERFGPTPYDYKLYFILGHVWVELGDLHKSISYAERSASLAPRFANAHRALMYLYHSSAQYDKALKSGRLAAKLCPGDAAIATEVKSIKADAARRIAR